MCPRFWKLSLARIKIIIVTIIVISTVCSIILHLVLQGNLQNVKKMEPVKLDHIVVHFDFKGSPPKLSYLMSIFPLLKKYNVNGLLLEYEDMFPYEGKLKNLSARNSYSKVELEKFLYVADSFGFDIIPLIQTFGHLEYALKLPEFMHLREEPLFPDAICPSRLESMELISEMLTQVMTFHANVSPLRYVHIGSDEVYHMNSCKHCSMRNQSNLVTFLTHVANVSKIVKNISPRTSILVWDDMFTNIIPDERIRSSFSDITPVYWYYGGATNYKRDHKRLHAYQQLFGRMWVATAFKGADGPTRIFPDMRKRYANHLYWLNTILKFGMGERTRSTIGKYKFEGIILTGWSRYSHMEPSCELLPASIPSLMLNLIVIEKYLIGQGAEYEDEYDFIDSKLQSDLISVLKCPEDTIGFRTTNCSFEGSDLYAFLNKYIAYKQDFSRSIRSRYDADNPEDDKQMVNFVQGYINMNHVATLTRWCLSAQQKLAEIESEMMQVMSKYFDKDVIDEYVYCKLYTMKNHLYELSQLLTSATVVKVWRRRPINMSIDRDGSYIP